jgi:hypothetical protein
MLSIRPLQAAFLLPLALLACSSGNPNGFVFYKAPITLVDGRSHTRTLLVTGAGAALGVEQDAVGGLWIREGNVGPDEVDPLFVGLWRTRSVREKAVGVDPTAGVYQISARVDRVEFSYRRYVTEPVADEVEGARTRLDRIWESLPEQDDRVAVIEKYLGSRIARIRGFAVNGLLSVWRSPNESEEDRARAETALSSQALVETNHQIKETLHQALKKQSPR